MSNRDTKQIVEKTMASFWEKAVGHDGRQLQPATEKERHTIPIPESEVDRVVDEAVLYGVALWCGVDWKPVYLQYMKVERTKTWSEKQLAFIGMLFGVTQGTIRGSMTRECTPEQRTMATVRVAEERDRLESISRPE